MAGDVEPNEVFHHLAKILSGRPLIQAYEPTGSKIQPLQVSENRHLDVAGKTGVKLFLGHGIPLTRTDTAYESLALANMILGGSFSSRLTQYVREKLGLTYSIHSSLTGFRSHTEGAFLIASDFRPMKVGEGLRETRQLFESFVADGVRTEELQAKKNEWIGLHKIRFSHTPGMVNRMAEAERLGLGITYVKNLPSMINQISLEQVNQVIQQYLHPDKLQIVTAGAPLPPANEST